MIGVSFSNRVFYPLCCLPTAESTAPAAVAATTDSAAKPFPMPGQAGCAGCMRCRLSPRQRDSSEPTGITSRRLSPVRCRSAPISHKPMNRICVLVVVPVCCLWVSDRRIAGLAHAMYVVLYRIQWYTGWLQETKAPNWRTSRLASSSASDQTHPLQTPAWSVFRCSCLPQIIRYLSSLPGFALQESMHASFMPHD